jgi:putative ABC transport system permease protein
VLQDKSSIVLSESLATQLFGSPENAIGKALEWQHERQHQVSGVFMDLPSHSSMQFDFVMPFETFKENNEWVYKWGSTAPNTFLRLEKGADLHRFNQKIAGMVEQKTNGNIKHRQPFATPFADSYLYNQYENGLQSGGRIEYVRLFSIIAIFILAIACINFMNLSTAKASQRLKEIGIRKVIGAQRSTLIYQFLGEATIMVFLSICLALLMVAVLLPQFSILTEKQLSLEFTFSFLGILLAIVIFTGILAGGYPALYLSQFKPAAVLKGGKLTDVSGKQWARKGLVVFQFALSVLLIIAVGVVYLQIEYVQNQHLGYEKENIIMFGKEGQLNESDRLETFLSEVKTIPGIRHASTMGHTMTEHNSGTSDVSWPGKDPEDRTDFERFAVNYDMVELLDFTVLEGRSFSRDFGADSTKIILNETAIAHMGIENPIGKSVKLGMEEKEIVGVVKDFHFESFHEEVKPSFFYIDLQRAWNIFASIEAGKEQECLEKLQGLYSSFNPGFAFDYRFLDQNYQKLYDSERRVSTLSKYFALLAILISCLGLFGLAAFTAERRTKEIGIRKTLGASETGIVRLLSGEFFNLVMVAIVLAIPVSYFFAQYYLESFAFRITLEWWHFVGAGALTMLIALVTVSYQSIKAALMNPVKALRSE